MSRTITIALPSSREAGARRALEAAGFVFRPLDHAFWQARGPGAIVSWYRSGKVVVQGTDAATVSAMLQDRALDAFVADLGGEAEAGPGEATVARSMRRKEKTEDAGEAPASWAPTEPGGVSTIGSDETGKGDYFGPLVVVAAWVDVSMEAELEGLGVTDSKAMSDGAIARIAPMLRALVPHETMILLPPTYNRLWAESGNVNRLMAKCHATVINRLASVHEADRVVVDAFTPDEVVRPLLRNAAARAAYEQRPRAESEPAVAAASVLARATFVEVMDGLSRRFGVSLHKGAGAPTLESGRRFVARWGAERLPLVAKVHFRTTKELTG